MADETFREARILVADDEPANVRLLERILQQAGYGNVRTTTDARQVVPLFGEMEPDLVLLDLLMPHMDGLAVMRALAPLIPAGGYVPVLVLTADITPAAKQQALSTGAKDFVTKPFDHAEVLLRIRNLLETRFVYRELERHNRELERTVRERTEQLLRSEKLATMGEMLAGVAHELNNPLSVMLGQTALLMEQTGEGPFKARAVKIAGAGERCARIVKNFLALARQHPPERRSVALNRVVEGAIELVAYQLRVGGIEVRLDLAEDLPRLWADPHQLDQVLVNLATNALHAMRDAPPPRRLTFTTRHDVAQGRVSIEVADTGPGIPADVQARIFDAFFTTKPLGEGTGLGLAICRGILESHGGCIEVESEPGRGATFRIDLAVQAPPEPVREAAAPSALAAPRGCSVLVVDDEPTILDLLRDFLTAEDHSVDTASDGLVALEKLRQRAYDVIISDLKMPRLNGAGLYREIQRDFPDLARRVIFVTGDVLGGPTTEFLAGLPNPRVSKPFDFSAIRLAIHKML